jgi:amphi-Trp domain-containing protein
MPEEILFESESDETVADVAAYLRAVADALDGDGSVTLRAGDREVVLTVPERVTFEVKAEREPSTTGPDETSLEVELEWADGDGAAGAEGDASLAIE